MERQVLKVEAPAERKRRYKLFKIGLWMLFFSFLGMCLHYKIEKAIFGVPPEYYPEYLWLFIAMPISGFITFLGLCIAVLKMPGARIEGKK